jgi:hypothetical protein
MTERACQCCGFPPIYCRKRDGDTSPGMQWARGAVPFDYPRPGWQAFEKFPDRTAGKRKRETGRKAA